ncbi:hypothetical protein PTSG_00828 [Salpingoeca rosetta]|uniref:Tetrapyrrole biosynthesis uroporphyrinogen III synthase domain-containing protein n=1 Tax=Salpingoeca rosetta (strain ATCC 50818 / BSB-021) TaxID=946362 RepID=F2TXL2_SALR5|nr:uncharacterized protein PTSG_00828 [Salpingoeca rosetta]EGD76121.1 hypothetical protein PTSG_00828 [Salpingoeca rosetta]|eukprot:XP_004998296.1 hypothetical protein PTSG_00828 [Salpingoeca rosetta]
MAFVVVLKEEDSRYKQALAPVLAGDQTAKDEAQDNSGKDDGCSKDDGSSSSDERSSSARLQFVPVLQVEHTKGEAVDRQLLELLHTLPNAGIIITSSNAITAATSALSPAARQLIKDKPGFFVGDKTATAAAHALQLKVAIVANKAKELGERLVSEVPCSSYIFLCGDPHRPELPTLLQAHSIPLHEVVCYSSVIKDEAITHVQQLLQDCPSPILVIFSPSVARRVNALLSTDAANSALARMVTIGPTTAAEITRAPVFVAEKPTPAHVAHALELALQHHPHAS